MGELSDGSYTSFLSLDCYLIFTVNSANLCLISEVTLTKMHAGVEQTVCARFSMGELPELRGGAY